MDAFQILGLLKNKHSGPSWAFFENVRSYTGYKYDKGERYLDAYTVGLWKQNNTCIAYEIKVSVQDFRSDIENFTDKQSDAMRNSNQFYYICPNNLIQPEEVPEISGLIYAGDKSLRIKKVAPIREMPNNCLDFDFIKSLLRNAATKVDSNPLWKYYGRDLNEQEILKLAEEKGHIKSDWEIKNKATEIAATKRLGSYKAIKKLREAMGVHNWGEPYEAIDEIINAIVENKAKISEIDAIKAKYNNLKMSVDKLGELLNERTT
jgi:hypothetical protein